LTLARVRDAKGLRTQTLFDGLDGTLGATAVRTITLFQSRLSPKGPTYVALQSTRLRWKN
jgi:2'-5' RNA ligase